MNQVFACLGRLREAEGLSWGAGEGRQGSSAGCADLHQVGSVLEVFYPGSSALWAGG